MFFGGREIKHTTKIISLTRYYVPDEHLTYETDNHVWIEIFETSIMKSADPPLSNFTKTIIKKHTQWRALL